MSPIAARPTSTGRCRRRGAAFESGVWRDADPQHKKTVLLRFAELIRENIEELALLETLDVGKVIANALAVDVPFCANCIQYYAELADKLYDEVAPRRRERRRAGAQGAARRHRRHRAVELSADHRRLEDRPGAGRRQFRGAEAGRAVAARLARARHGSPSRRACPTACSTSCRASARRPASRSRCIRTST